MEYLMYESRDVVSKMKRKPPFSIQAFHAVVAVYSLKTLLFYFYEAENSRFVLNFVSERQHK